jgi:hypothetical protein
MVEGLLARHALRNVGVASIVRRGLAVAPRMFLGLLPVLLIAYAPVVAALWLVEPSSLASEHGSLWGDERELGAERWTIAVEAALAGWSLLVSPLVAAAMARPTIRAAFGERTGLGTVLGESLRAMPRALPAAMLAGVATIAGFGLLVIPGFVVASWLFVLGAVVAVERRGIGAAFSRAAALTRGSRWQLVGVVFVIGFVERFVFRAVAILGPRTLDARAQASDEWLFLAVALVASLAMTVWRGAATAVAYDELRVRADGLEIDAVVREVGGRAVVGVELGAEAATSSRIGAMQRRRKGLVWLVVSAAVLALGYLVAAPFAADWWKEHQRVARYERESRERAEQERARLERSRAAASARATRTEPGAIDPAAPTPEELDAVDAAPPEPEETNDALAARLRAAGGSERRSLLGQEVAQRATELWGPGFAGALRQLAKVADAELELAIVPALGQEAQASGCNQAFKSSREGELEGQSARFAKGCPPGAERRAVDPKRLRQVPLWAGALAVLLELRARDRSMTNEPLHRAVIDALLAERISQ